jgi:hypothetical protein
MLAHEGFDLPPLCGYLNRTTSTIVPMSPGWLHMLHSLRLIAQ